MSDSIFVTNLRAIVERRSGEGRVSETVGLGEVPSIRDHLDFEEEATTFFGAIGRVEKKINKREEQGGRIQQDNTTAPTQ